MNRTQEGYDDFDAAERAAHAFRMGGTPAYAALNPLPAGKPWRVERSGSTCALCEGERTYEGAMCPSCIGTGRTPGTVLSAVREEAKTGAQRLAA